MRPTRTCVIGAGPSGIAAARCLLDAGIQDLVVFDRGRKVGGNWVFDAESGHSSVFETTHIISSKTYSQYADFPFPEGTPDYPSHAHLAAYFQSYADRFGVTDKVQFRHSVLRCVPTDSGFDVHVQDDATGQTRTESFSHLVVANGHHYKPRWPDLGDGFTGQLLHSHDFKRAAPFAGERILVIGGGNSACDVAVETSRVAESVHLSWRRGYRIVPKFVLGKPSDELHNRSHRYFGWLPLRWRMRGLELLLHVIIGRNRAYGLPEADHRLGESHPTVNSELLYSIRHGKIQPKPGIDSVHGKTVRFADGSEAEFDTIIACTGFEITHPFFDPSFIDFSEGPVPLYLKMLPEDRDNLAFVGLFQPLGCIWPCAELQGRLLAKLWTGAWVPPADRAAAIRQEVEHPDLPQLNTARHTITVDEPTFRARLTRELSRAERQAAPERS
ncbi:MAG: flavin-containing monooxygenase [Myxococcota bacterium]